MYLLSAWTAVKSLSNTLLLKSRLKSTRLTTINFISIAPLPAHQITLAELYYRWLHAHTANTAPSQSTLASYANSFKHLGPLHYEPFQSLKYADYKKILDSMRKSGLSYSSCKKVRSLISLLEKYAVKIELINKCYVPLLSIGKNKAVRPHHPFSRQKINRLWVHCDDSGVDTVLILLYTGMRVGEMLALTVYI